jgi:hypothetical protein
MPGFFLGLPWKLCHLGIAIASMTVCQLGTRRVDMKYIVAWALGVPGVLIVGWFLFNHI